MDNPICSLSIQPVMLDSSPKLTTVFAKHARVVLIHQLLGLLLRALNAVLDSIKTNQGNQVVFPVLQGLIIPILDLLHLRTVWFAHLERLAIQEPHPVKFANSDSSSHPISLVKIAHLAPEGMVKYVSIAL